MGDSAFDDISKDITWLLTRNAHCLRSFGDELRYLIVHKEEQRRYNTITMTKGECHGDAQLHKRLSAQNGSSWYIRYFQNLVSTHTCHSEGSQMLGPNPLISKPVKSIVNCIVKE